jgi:pimeloyl-ACP methyl ester carboxylesterase
MIIMIHGIGDCGADLAPVSEVLAEAIPIYAPSRRPLPAAATFDDTVEDFLKQLDEAKIGPSFFLGYSFGGLIALTIAHRYPQRCAASSPCREVIYDDRTMNHLRHIISRDRLRQTIGPKVPVFERRWGMTIAELAESAMGIYDSFAAKPPLSDDDLRAIQAPVLLVSGEQDQVTSRNENAAPGGHAPESAGGILPGQAHPIGRVPAAQVKEAVIRFVAEVEEGRFAGTRQAQPAKQPKERAWLG